MYTIDIADEQTIVNVGHPQVTQIARAILAGEGISRATISIAIVDDPTIHELNRRHLDHDYATDVLSFVFDEADGLDGEVIVSAETAARSAADYDTTAERELLYYIIHGMLHLTGYTDKEESCTSQMRAREQFYLGQLS